MDYGFSFFNIAVYEHHRLLNEEQRRVAVAVRMAQNADANNWSKYMRKKY